MASVASDADAQRAPAGGQTGTQPPAGSTNQQAANNNTLLHRIQSLW